MDGHEHHIQCLGFEILRWFLTHPCDLQPLQRLADSGKESAQFVSLVRRLEALPAIRNMQPLHRHAVGEGVGTGAVLVQP
jgi:hypothetical protein